jgi:GT2 family glycosyltransferase
MYYPDNTIQHAGVAVPFNADLPCGHVFALVPKREHGYMARVTTTMNYRAVTGACLMCKRELYEKTGYMDEELAKAYNDADLCMKFLALGLVNVYLPTVEFMHYESKTRKYDTTRKKKVQFNHECDYFIKKWDKELKNGDPYYNPEIEKVR